MEEIWKDVNVEGFSHLYQVSNFGNVRSKDRVVKKIDKNGNVYDVIYRGKMRKPTNHNMGYKKLVLHNILHKKNFFIHRLIALTFIDNSDTTKKHINHINGNKKDNNVSNLEWTNASLNAIHAVSLGLKKSGKDSTLSKPIYQIDKLSGEIVKKFECIKDVKKEIGFKESNIRFALKDENKTAYGFKWKYVN